MKCGSVQPNVANAKTIIPIQAIILMRIIETDASMKHQPEEKQNKKTKSH